MSDLPPPRQPYRATAILYAILSGLILAVAAISGGGMLKALLVAVAFFLIATGWSWFRLRQQERKAAPPSTGPTSNGRP